MNFQCEAGNNATLCVNFSARTSRNSEIPLPSPSPSGSHSNTRPKRLLARAMSPIPDFSAKSETRSLPTASDSAFNAGVAMMKFPNPMGHNTKVFPWRGLGIMFVA